MLFGLNMLITDLPSMRRGRTVDTSLGAIDARTALWLEMGLIHLVAPKSPFMSRFSDNVVL